SLRGERASPDRTLTTKERANGEHKFRPKPARQSPTLPGARGGEIPPRDSPAPSQMGFHLGRSGKSYSGSLQSRTRYCNYLTRNSCSGWRGEENDGLGDVLAFGPALKIFGFHCGNVRCSIDKPGGDGVDADCGISSFQR